MKPLDDQARVDLLTHVNSVKLININSGKTIVIQHKTFAKWECVQCVNSYMYGNHKQSIFIVKHLFTSADNNVTT